MTPEEQILALIAKGIAGGLVVRLMFEAYVGVLGLFWQILDAVGAR